MKKIFLLLIIMCLFVTGCSFSSEEEKKNDEKEVEIVTISVEEVKHIVDNYKDFVNVDIVDVRNPEEFAAGHIEGAINIPLLYIDEIHIDTERHIVVYCQSCRRSKEAAKLLMDMGYENVSDMGGIKDWTYELVEEEEIPKEHEHNYETRPGVENEPSKK